MQPGVEFTPTITGIPEIHSYDETPSRLTGYFRDSETGNDYAIDRYHEPGLGRFLSVDLGGPTPGSPGSWNRYAYASGDPVNRIDPGGMDCLVIDGGGACGCIVAVAARGLSAAYAGVGGCDDPPGGGGGGGCYSTGSPLFPDPVSPICEDPTPEPPPQPQPTCSISLWERPVAQVGGLADHLYLLVTSLGGSATLIEGGPIGGILDGLIGASLCGYDSSPPGGGLRGSGPGLPGNVQVGSTYSGSDACSIINFLTLTVNNYDAGPLDPYFFDGHSVLGYNSNGFIYTLLYDEMGTSFSNVLSYFGIPTAFVPGWGIAVPGLLYSGLLNGGN